MFCGRSDHCKEMHMISWAVVFFVVALLAAVFGFTGLAGTAVNIAWLLVVVGIVLAVVFALMGRGGRI
jgi:uncharacterized membrane protein YtjA (UPF0391 family)